MSKFRLPKFNSLVTTLVLASIGLHGLVLALPMPSLIEEKTEEPPERIEPEVIQVVTLPKLAKEPDSLQPPLPEPPPLEESLPEPPVPEPPVEEIVLTNPEILDEIEPVEENVEDDIKPEDNPVEESDSQPSETPDDSENVGKYEGEYNSEQVNQRNFDISIAWEPRVKAEFGIPEDVAVGFLKDKDLENPLQPFKPSACLENAPSDEVTVGIVLDENDELLGDPELLSHTGYPEMDSELIEFARTINYLQQDSSNIIKHYWLSLPIDYERCTPA